MQCPYEFEKARIIVREMTELLVLAFYDEAVNPKLLVRRAQERVEHEIEKELEEFERENE